MTSDRDLPWLQDTIETNVQGVWEASYRDVILLDAANRPIGTPFNLTSQNLADEDSREAFKERLRNAAVLVDTDGDLIGDDWEERFFGDLTELPEGDPDQDDATNLLEYATGSRPNSVSDQPALSPIIETTTNGNLCSVTFRQRLGNSNGLQYKLQWSRSGETWTDGDETFSLLNVINPYDGTGTEVATYQALEPLGEKILIRLKIETN